MEDSITMAFIKYLGDLRRECHHIKIAGGESGEYEPTLVLYLEGRLGKCSMIPLSCLYKYDEPETRAEQAQVMEECRRHALHLGIDTSTPSLAQLAMFIADGLDDLLKLPPFEEKQVAVGEVELLAGGQKIAQTVSVSADNLAIPNMERVTQ